MKKATLASYRRTTGTFLRTTHFNWCEKTETNKVCRKCLAIVPETRCIHCERGVIKKEARLKKFLESKKAVAFYYGFAVILAS